MPAAGPMDYTQGAMRNATKENFRWVDSEAMSQGTRCRQLAEYVVFESPLNMLCDSPSNYMSEPECTKYIAECPVVWDESVGVNGVMGEYVTIARRSSDVWSVGALTDWTARDMVIDMPSIFFGNNHYIYLMADNYLEKKYDEVFGSGASSRRTIANRPSLESLMRRNRSYRGYDKQYVVHRRQLETIVRVNTLLASGMNAQRLRFRLVTKGEDADKVLRLVKMGAALKELHLPLPGTEPESFIIVCATAAESPVLDIDLGISAQSMLLKAVELGLGGLIIRNFDAAALREALSLPLDPLLVIAIGKPSETVQLVTVGQNDSLSYYRKDGIHFVPKLSIDELTI